MVRHEIPCFTYIQQSSCKVTPTLSPRMSIGESACMSACLVWYSKPLSGVSDRERLAAVILVVKYKSKIQRPKRTKVSIFKVQVGGSTPANRT